jgi:MYND finger
MAKSKDQKLFESAMNRVGPKTPALVGLLEDLRAFETGTYKPPGPSDGLIAKSKLIKQYHGKWQAQHHELFEHHNAANHDFSAYNGVIRLATEMLNDMDQVLDRLGMLPRNANEAKDSGYASVTMLNVYRLRSYARMKRGIYSESILDATEGLALVRLGLGETEDPSKPCKALIAMLLTRGFSLWMLYNLDDAYLDTRAACAALRITKQSWEGWPTVPHATTNLFSIMALRKIRGKSPRPHYTEKEIDSILKEHRLPPYAPDNHKCEHCGKRPKDLRLCCGCREAWFCGEECQLKSWKACHKKECQQSRRPLFRLVLGKDQDEIETEIDKSGYFVLTGSDDEPEPVIVVRDAATGELFDSLRDGKLIFKTPPPGDAIGLQIITHRYKSHHYLTVTMGAGGIRVF